MQLLAIGAVLIEALTENIKILIIEDREKKPLRIAIFLLSILVTWLLDINLFEYLNIPIKYDIAGVVITGVFLARGSNYIHDLMARIGGDRGE